MNVGRYVLGICLFLALLPSVQADGVLIPPTPRAIGDPRVIKADLQEPTQKALLAWDDNLKVETLILQISYKGNVDKFAWVVPTPSEPKVEKIDDPVFESLSGITAPEFKYRFDSNKRIDDPLGLKRGFERLFMVGTKGGQKMPPRETTVTVVERKQIGIYDIAVLRADDKQSLFKWLTQNGYYVSEKLSSVASDYIRGNWVFTAMRINPAQQADAQKRIKEGELQTVSLKFKSNEPVYPLKISSANKGSTNVLLYTIAEHRLADPRLKTVCCIPAFHAYSVSTTVAELIMEARESQYDNIRNSTKDSRIGQTSNRPAMPKSHGPYSTKPSGVDRKSHHQVKPKSYGPYLTKLSGTFTQDQMDRDIVLKPVFVSLPWRFVIKEPEPIPAPFLQDFGSLSLMCFLTIFTLPYSLLFMGISICIYYTRFGKAHRKLVSFAIVLFIAPFLKLPIALVFMVVDSVNRTLVDSIYLSRATLICICSVGLYFTCFAKVRHKLSLPFRLAVIFALADLLITAMTFHYQGLSGLYGSLLEWSWNESNQKFAGVVTLLLLGGSIGYGLFKGLNLMRMRWSKALKA